VIDCVHVAGVISGMRRSLRERWRVKGIVVGIGAGLVGEEVISELECSGCSRRCRYIIRHGQKH